MTSYPSLPEIEGFPRTLKLGSPRLHHSPRIPARPKTATAHCRGENRGSERPSDPPGVPKVMFFPLVHVVALRGWGDIQILPRRLSSLETPSFPGLFLFAGGEDFLFLDSMFLWRGNPSPQVKLWASLFSPGLRVGIASLCSDSPPCLGIRLSRRELVFCAFLATWDWGRRDV